MENGLKAEDLKKCIRYYTNISYRYFNLSFFLVFLLPFIFRFGLGYKAVVGLLLGSFLSAVQLANSSTNAGGAWNNVKNNLEKLRMSNTEEY